MTILGRLLSVLGLKSAAEARLPGEMTPSSEAGLRPTPENALTYLYRRFQIDYSVRSMILDIREMDREDGRVKKLHGRMARAATKGGLRLVWEGPESDRITRHWQRFSKRLGLHRPGKLESDCRGLVMEGNLPMQWVLSPAPAVQVVDGVRMPTDTLTPQVDESGRFPDPAVAYIQYNLNVGQKVAEFGLWQMTLGRLDPDNWDDHGSFGRPYLDATRSVWRKLRMTEEDLVIRRRQRAPLRFSHVLEGATDAELNQYKAQTELKKGEINTDFYLNKKGAVTALQGDANLDEIGDVNYLLDTFFSGAPAPKGLFGYAGDLSRDILEDLKKDFFDELDALQDTLAAVYRQGFELDLLLAGINPDSYQFDVQFAERRTETRNQRADLALKIQAMGASRATVWETAGIDSAVELDRLKQQAKRTDPYPEPGLITPASSPAGRPNVSITPGNQHKGESATTISTRGGG